MRHFVLGLAWLAASATWFPANEAFAFEAGGHFGLNLDRGDVHVGADLLFPLTELSPQVRLSIWPSFAHVFVHGGHDVWLPGVDFPFEFRLNQSIVQPFVGPGLGLAIYGDATPKFNVIGGMFIDAGPVRPFGELALRFIRGTFVDFLFGVMFEL